MPDKPPPERRSDGAWVLTGAHRLKHHWCWYGWVHFALRLVVEVEERRDVFRPRVSGHSPDNWQERRRWRPAHTPDLSAIYIKTGKAIT